jgi:hypothetical protein
MSLVTQCPQCALLFQVSAQPLASAQWRVRCGQCAHEFDGKAFAVSPPQTQPKSQPHRASNTELQRDSALSAQSFTASLSESSSGSSADSLLNAPRIDLEVLLRRQDVPVASLAAVHAAAPSAPPIAALPIALQATASPPELAAKPGAHVPSAGAARLTDGLLRGSALLLVLSLCFQALVFFKDELVARIPATKPMLESLCVPAACTLAPLRRWNGIVIQSASLVRGDLGYTLNLSLRNAVDVPLAMTAIELTLTNPQDRAVLRRVLSPADMAAPLELAAGQIWARAFTVEPGTLTSEIAGYRLVSFYP